MPSLALLSCLSIVMHLPAPPQDQVAPAGRTAETKPASRKALAPKIQRQLDAGDALYLKREQEGMAAKAIEAWQKVLAADEACADAYWRIARAHFWLGSQAKDDAKKQQIFKDGIEYAKLGVAADAESTSCHFWLGVMYGSYGQAVGASQSLHMVDPIKHEMNWILARDEGFDEGGAHRVLGRLYYKLPGLMGGDNQKAKDHLRRSIELGGKNTLNFLYLAEVHIDDGEKDQARALLTKLLSLPDDPDYLPETRQNKARAQELLRELGEE